MSLSSVLVEASPIYQDMQKKFPLLFLDPKDKLIECSYEGWSFLLYESLYLINREVECMPNDLKDGIRVSQIKAKFGGLRIYMTNTTPFIRGVIALAEHLSYSVCERCGNKAETRNIENAIYTLCSEHFNLCSEHFNEEMTLRKNIK